MSPEYAQAIKTANARFMELTKKLEKLQHAMDAAQFAYDVRCRPIIIEEDPW